MKKFLYITFGLFLFNILLIAVSNSFACDYTVSTKAGIEDLTTSGSGSEASDGEVICITDGTYDDFATQGSPVTVSTSGSNGSEITIKPETVGGVTFTGTMGWSISGDYIILRDFKYSENDEDGVTVGLINIEGDNNRVTNNHFYDIAYDGHNAVGSGIRVESTADSTEIDYNTFDTWYETKPLVITGTNTHIHHNYYENNHSADGDSAHQIGSNDQGNTDLSTIIEYDYYKNVLSDAEVLSIKSTGNTIRYCVFDGGNALTLRFGASNTVDNNWFFDPDNNSPSLRVADEDHTIINNYFEGSPANRAIVTFLQGTCDEPDGVCYPDLKNILFANNTIKQEGDYGIYIFGDGGAYDPDSLTFQNNLIDKNNGSGGYIFSLKSGGAFTGFTYTTNLCNQYGDTLSHDDSTLCNTVESSTRLSSDGSVYRLSSGEGGGTVHASVTDDFDGDARDGATPDRGADEYDAGYTPVFFSSDDVGYEDKKISNPSPADNDTGIAIGAPLSWGNPNDYDTVDVYFEKIFDCHLAQYNEHRNHCYYMYPYDSTVLRI